MSSLIPVRYTKLDQIGVGGFGSVYRYSDDFLDREIAIKIINKNISGSDASTEVKFIKKVDSKHVVAIFDVIEDQNEIVLIQEFLAGNNVEDFKGQCDKDTFLTLMYQIVRGISDIHHQDICHRDIKLANMKCDAEGLLKIFDFGISRTGKEHDTVNGNTTIAYAAPELFELQNTPKIKVTFAVDIYSLGVTLWELGTGRLENFKPLLPRCKKLPDFEKLDFGFSNELTQALNNCLNPSPLNRPTAIDLYNLVLKEMLFNRHQGKFVSGEHIYVMNVKNSNATITINGFKLSINYTGNDFVVNSVDGTISCNNSLIEVGFKLPPACVLTFRNTQSHSFISFSSSHPEVVL
jgi:serine/threonine protein kinase